MSDKIKLFDHPSLGEIFLEYREDDLDYYFDHLRKIFHYYLDDDLNLEQVSLSATIIKEYLIKKELLGETSQSSKIIRLANYISGLSAIKSEDRLEKIIERVRKYIYEQEY